MAGYLISGPAGAGKSAAAAALAAELAQPVQVHFQELYAALLGIQRDPLTGRYPERNPADAYIMPTVEYTRRAIITSAVERDLDVIASNSDGSPVRRAQLLGYLGQGAVERIVDPGRDVVAARLADPVSGVLSLQCEGALSRWFGESRQIELRQTADTLHGVLIAEGRASSGGRREVFTPGAVEWRNEGVAILPEHRGAVETRVIPERQADGAITFSAKLTDGMRRAWEAGRRYMSVEFQALSERTVKGGIREVQRALVVNGAMVANPEYDTAVTELRDQTSPETDESDDLWLLL